MILNMIIERFHKKDLPKLISTCFQIEKSLIKDHIHVSKVSSKFHIPTIYNFAAICP